MKSGRVSQTALKVALMVVALSADERWAKRLPPGMASMTERLLLAADVPLFRDGMIRFMKGGFTQWIYRRSSRTRGTYDGVGERKRFMNAQALATIEEGFTQVLVLGAGFDTLCLRLAPRFAEVRWFELDHPATAAAKARGIAAVGQPDNMHCIVADLAQRRLSAVLEAEAAWDPQARTLVVAEGLLMYLTPPQVEGLFDEVRATTAAGSRMAFSHLLSLEEHSAFRRAGLHLVGEPWQSSYTAQALPQAIAKFGWRVQEQACPPGALEGLAIAQYDHA